MSNDQTTPPKPRGRHGSKPGRGSYDRALSVADTPDARLVAACMDAARDDEGRRLTQEQFAATVLECNPRTLRKYLTGVNPLRPLQRTMLRERFPATAAALAAKA